MFGGYARDHVHDLRASTERGATRQRLHSVPALALVALVGLLAASLAGCASAGFGAHLASTSAPKASATTAPTSRRMNPLGDGLFCATQFAWSPDSTRIAVVGNGVNCSGAAAGREPGMIVIYSRDGKLLQKLQPDDSVLAQPTIARKVAANSAAGGMISTLTYDNLTWTPNSQALLMTFDLELQTSPNEGSITGAQGVQRLGLADTSLTKVWLDPTTSRTAGTIERWDLLAGSPTWVANPAKSTAYQWSADGMLTPVSALVGMPVGAPDGGQTFAAWQPGNLFFVTKSDKATENATVVAQDIGWVSYISPLSPDGRYYYPTLIASGSLVPPSTQRVVANEPMLQPHDQALVALGQQLMQTPSPSQNSGVLVAWRPDGRYLAAYAPNAADPSANTFAVAIYDTASGKLVKRVTPDFTGLHASPAGIIALRWSSDGSHLLLADNVYGAITVWGPGALPR